MGFMTSIHAKTIGDLMDFMAENTAISVAMAAGCTGVLADAIQNKIEGQKPYFLSKEFLIGAGAGLAMGTTASLMVQKNQLAANDYLPTYRESVVASAPVLVRQPVI
jgi:hypothetical protein